MEGELLGTRLDHRLIFDILVSTSEVGRNFTFPVGLIPFLNSIKLEEPETYFALLQIILPKSIDKSS